MEFVVFASVAVKFPMTGGYFWCHTSTFQWSLDMVDCMYTQFGLLPIGISIVATLTIFWTFYGHLFLRK